MNRQFVAFLSMFSLVLVLSIYYVMLPSKTKKPSADPVISNVEEGTDPYFDMMILEQETQHKEVIDQQYDIIASSEYTNAEKAIALELIEKEEQTMKSEKDLRDIIIGMGKPTCFVEINEKDVYVLTVSENKTMQEVAEIIFSVQDYLHAEMNVQVSFR
ncbi:uncharacterized protein BN794_00326 [Coprobacillus sp. CAG:826]|jgi:stage III sporulation protein AH|nr:hypothetical protein [Coprobacillus sp.]CDD91279.1 uncharacterized protein BN794_00326 [Coprobacillus sp. CAG:826]